MEAALHRAMAERGVSFKRALNDAVRAGTSGPRSAPAPARTRARDLGAPRVDLDGALDVAGDLEDAELARRLTTRQ